MPRKLFLPLWVVAAAIILSGCKSTLPNDSWSTSLAGADAGAASDQLRSYGYRRVDSVELDLDGTANVWFSQATLDCLAIIVVNGKVDSAIDIKTHPKCATVFRARVS